MSLFNQLGEYGLNQVLARRLTTPGPAPSPTLEPALFPTIALEVDRPEWGWFKGEVRYGAVAAVAAVAAQNSRVRLINPLGSGTIAVVERIWAISTGSTSFLVRNSSVPPTLTAASSTPLDGRQPVTALSARCQLSGGTEVGLAPSAQAFFGVPSATVLDYNTPLVLVPGSSFEVYLETVNIAITRASFSWRERPAQPGEV